MNFRSKQLIKNFVSFTYNILELASSFPYGPSQRGNVDDVELRTGQPG